MLGVGCWVLGVLLFIASAHAGSIETFDGVVTTGAVTFDTGLFVIKPADGPAVKIDPAEVLRAQVSSAQPGDNMMPGVILRNGSRIAGGFSALTEPQVTFARYKIAIPGGEIAWVI